jgi:hypothetical protein
MNKKHGPTQGRPLWEMGIKTKKKKGTKTIQAREL